jgi:hypothetical protein
VTGSTSPSEPYQSGDFAVPVPWSCSVAPAAAVYGQHLWFVGADSDHQLVQAMLTLLTDDAKSIDFESGAALQSSNWAAQAIAVPGTSSMQTLSRCGVAPAGDDLIMCWNATGEGGALRASRYTTAVSGSQKPGWQTVLTLIAAGDQFREGLACLRNDAQVAVVAIDSETIVVGCTSVNAWWSSGPGTLYLGTFNINDINLQNNTWQARTDIWGPGPVASLPFGPGYLFPDFGATISLDWFTAAGSGSSSNPSEPTAGTPATELWVTLEPDSPSVQATFVMPVVPTLDQQGASIESYQIQWAAAAGWASPVGGAVVRDPAGRICQYRCDPTHGQITVGTYATWTAPAASAPQPLPMTPSTMAAAYAGSTDPSVAFFIDTSTNTSTDPSFTANPIYQIAVYGVGAPHCQVDRYGTAEVHPGLGPLSPVKAGSTPADMLILSGIVDGPIPVPNVNIADTPFPSGETVFGTVVYGQTASSDHRHSVSNSWTAGFMSSSESTKGFGPAWDVSLNGGMASVSADEQSQSWSVSVQSSAVLSSNKPPTQTVDPRGNLFGVEAAYEWTAYRFLDAAGNPVVDGLNGNHPDQQAPLFTTVSCRFTDSGARGFIPYAVAPGDLSSYTVEALNARMRALGHPSSEYFSEVVEPNAYVFPGGARYIPVSWDNSGGRQQATFESVTTAFTESSWSLDASLYVGVSGGEGASIFGLGENWSFKFLVGGTYSRDVTTTDEKVNEWSLGLAEGYGAFGPCDAPKQIANYTFRIYFLPAPTPSAGPNSLAPNYWVKELIEFLPKAPGEGQVDPKSIDPNSGAWKIMFIVDSYESNDKTVKYP